MPGRKRAWYVLTVHTTQHEHPGLSLFTQNIRVKAFSAFSWVSKRKRVLKCSRLPTLQTLHPAVPAERGQRSFRWRAGIRTRFCPAPSGGLSPPVLSSTFFSVTLHPPSSLQTRLYASALAYMYKIFNKLRPKQLCHPSPHWQWGVVIASGCP